jgi:hypothetical protein
VTAIKNNQKSLPEQFSLTLNFLSNHGWHHYIQVCNLAHLFRLIRNVIKCIMSTISMRVQTFCSPSSHTLFPPPPPPPPPPLHFHFLLHSLYHLLKHSGWFLPIYFCLTMTTLKSKSKSHYNWESLSQSVLVSSPIWGSWPDISYCLTVTVLSLWGTLPDKQMGLSFVRVIISSNMSVVRKSNIFTFYVFHMLLNVYTIYTKPLLFQVQ